MFQNLLWTECSFSTAPVFICVMIIPAIKDIVGSNIIVSLASKSFLSTPFKITKIFGSKSALMPSYNLSAPKKIRIIPKILM